MAERASTYDSRGLEPSWRAGRAPPRAPRPTGDSVASATLLDGDGARWIAAVGRDGPIREAALTELRALLTGVVWFELERRREQLHDPSIVQLNRLVRDARENACDALLEQLRDYRGQSRFQVWAAKFGIRAAAAAARRRSDSPKGKRHAEADAYMEG